MTSQRLKILWHWVSMGPYHFARMRALAQRSELDLTVVESTCMDDHGWMRGQPPNGFDLITLSCDSLSSRVLKDTGPALGKILRYLRPDVVVSAGYSEPHSLSAIRSYKKDFPRGITVLWSESTQLDHRRRRLTEFVKRFFLSVFDGALAAGRPHASYLQQLGMAADKIQIVGNCVDNDFFSTRADEVRQGERALGLKLPRNFFLYVGRMIPMKNLSRLLEAYRLYRLRTASAAWDLVLVGTGPEEAPLRRLAKALEIDGVWFAGLRQVDELPSFYASASCLVLPSVTEPWGLVVNEAMASGIPVLVSDRCGCALDLIRDGVNGFVFDPLEPRFLAELFFKLSSGDVSIQSLGAHARETVAEFSPKLFALRVEEHLRSLFARKHQQLKGSYRDYLLSGLAFGGTSLVNFVWNRDAP